MNRPIILFDGVCNFCNGTVNFLLKRDKQQAFLFAPLQSARGQQLLEEYGLPKENNASFILIDEGKVYQKSSAALRLTKRLPWYWKVFQVFYIIPPFIRNALYDLIARNRYKWFGKKEECMVPTAEQRSRFLDF
jgi:predicted DCC family thiol-disulfide oxidoreductase YuxK